MIIYKIEHKIEGFNIPIIEYVLFNQNGSISLNLTICDNTTLQLDIPVSIDKYDSKVPSDHKLLTELPGVGRKTANVFLAEYYNYPYIGVDTHVERVSKRLGLASKKDDVLKVEKKLQKIFIKDEWAKRHLQLVLFGRYHCKAIKPDCDNCKIKDLCKMK